MRDKKQGVYRLKKAVLELGILADTLEESIDDNIDRHNALLEIDEIKWLITEGLKDLTEEN
jgi:hypothetical protein